jgi:hypothetical protein
MGRSARWVFTVAMLVSSLLAAAGPAAASLSLSMTPTFPSTLTVGQAGVPASLSIQNLSSSPEDAGSMSVNSITLVPACGAQANADCPAASVDPGSLEVSSGATGRAGTACSGTAFSVTTLDASQGKVRFSGSPVALGPGATCTIDFTFAVRRAPSKDASPAPGVQTAQLAAASATSNVNGTSAVAGGNSSTTVQSANATLATLALPSPGPASPGQVVSDTATVTGASGAPAPTGTVTFSRFFDAPGAAPCSGPSATMGPVPLTPNSPATTPPSATATSPATTATASGTIRFVASYSGDANYNALPNTPCGVPGENVTVQGFATIATQASPLGTATAGQLVSDTATVTGMAGGPVPTGTVSFTRFFDAPGAAPCSGASAVMPPGAVVPTTPATSPPSATATSPLVVASNPGTFRFVASYSGDANYPAIATTPCGAPGESVTVAPGPASGRYTPLTPARILDTRDGTGGVSGPVGPGTTVDVQATGRGGIPASGVTAVAMNVTVTQPTADGYLTLYASGSARPPTANLNFTPGKTVPNLVVVQVGANGKVSAFNSAGGTHVIFDVAGWYSDAPAGNAGRYQALLPARIGDSRDGTGGAVALGPGASLDLQVSGRGGVPASGVSAAVLDAAVTNTAGTSYLTVFPTGEVRPLAANLNVGTGETVANRVMAKLGSGGKVTIFNNSGSTDVVVDVSGYYTDASASGATGAFTATTPFRALDTRVGIGGISGPLPAGSTVDVQLTGQGGVPTTGVSAVVLNATVVGPAGPGFLTVFPAGTSRPLASDLNFAAGEIRPNLVVVKVGTGGKVSLFTSARTDVVFDVVGFFS